MIEHNLKITIEEDETYRGVQVPSCESSPAPTTSVSNSEDHSLSEDIAGAVFDKLADEKTWEHNIGDELEWVVKMVADEDAKLLLPVIDTEFTKVMLRSKAFEVEVADTTYHGVITYIDSSSKGMGWFVSQHPQTIVLYEKDKELYTLYRVTGLKGSGVRKI